jgi:phage gpG-like protein
MMNWGTTKLPGGVLKPKNAKALKIPLPGGKAATDLTKSMKKKGGKATKISTGKKTKTGRDVKQSVLFVKSVKIPARRYDDWTSEDQQEITIALRNYLQELMKGN